MLCCCYANAAMLIYYASVLLICLATALLLICFWLFAAATIIWSRAEYNLKQDYFLMCYCFSGKYKGGVSLFVWLLICDFYLSSYAADFCCLAIELKQGHFLICCCFSIDAVFLRLVSALSSFFNCCYCRRFKGNGLIFVLSGKYKGGVWLLICYFHLNFDAAYFCRVLLACYCCLLLQIDHSSNHCGYYFVGSVWIMILNLINYGFAIDMFYFIILAGAVLLWSNSSAVMCTAAVIFGLFFMIGCTYKGAGWLLTCYSCFCTNGAVWKLLFCKEGVRLLQYCFFELFSAAACFLALLIYYFCFSYSIILPIFYCCCYTAIFFSRVDYNFVISLFVIVRSSQNFVRLWLFPKHVLGQHFVLED